MTARTKVTPPELAKRWGISPDKVLSWIRNGELPAIDASTRRGGRPRYLIDEEDILAFEERRRVSVSSRRSRPREPKGNGPTQYF